MAREMDMILFGATGFTGKHCIQYIHKFAKSNGRDLKWGVAGRSKSKLEDVLKQCEKQYSIELGDIPIVLADVDNSESLEAMAAKARIIINCCGPYRFYGEQVIEACVKMGTHQVDVSGEPQYIESMVLKYGEEAAKKGIYIVSACGFDSIPCDLGVLFTEEKFNGTLNSVVSYLQNGAEKGAEGEALSGSSLNYGTWQSAVYGVAHENELRALRRQLFPNRLPEFKPKLRLKKMPHKPCVGKGWALPFPGSDRSVARRTQRYLFEKEKKRPVQIETYFVLPNCLSVLLLGFYSIIFGILCQFEFGRSILLNHPEKFSHGLFSREEPSEERIEKTWFKTRFYGEGWKEKLAEGTDEFTTPVNKSIVTEVRAKNPGYGMTCIALVLSAVVILTETHKLPAQGGVYPPGAAFAKTSLIKQLDENEVTFKVVEEKDI